MRTLVGQFTSAQGETVIAGWCDGLVIQWVGGENGDFMVVILGFYENNLTCFVP